MFLSMFNAFELGVIYAIMALGVYLSFRVLDFPDLTVDGSFVTGAAVAGVAILGGIPPIIASVLAALAGFLGGCMTGLLHTKGRINALLAGILMMIALYSINLRIMGKPNLSFLRDSTVFKQLNTLWEKTGIDTMFANVLHMFGLERVPSTFSIIIVMLIVTLGIKFLTDYFLKTEIGLALRDTVKNQNMIRSLSANTDSLIIIGIGISNGLVALSGALVAQYDEFVDANMGIGMIIIGLASVIIGEALFGTKTIARTTLAVIAGAIIYRMVVAAALRVNFLNTGDMKVITAVLVIVALVSPKILQARRDKKRRIQKRALLSKKKAEEV